MAHKRSRPYGIWLGVILITYSSVARFYRVTIT